MTQESFLGHLGGGGRETLSRQLVTRHYRRDEMVIAQDDDTRDVFFVLDGHARATIYSANGKMVAYRDIHAGDIFGELSAIDGAPRSATVSALDDLTVGRMTVGDFQGLIATDPDFTMALLRYFTQQSRLMTERIFEFSTMLVRDRLVRELVRLAEEYEAADGMVALTPAPTHFDLAARISTHREAVSREMSRLAKLGLISKSGGRLIVHDIGRLRAARASRD